MFIFSHHLHKTIFVLSIVLLFTHAQGAHSLLTGVVPTIHTEVQKTDSEIVIPISFTSAVSLTRETLEVGGSMSIGLLYIEDDIQPVAYVDPSGRRHLISRAIGSHKDIEHSRPSTGAYNGSVISFPPIIRTGDWGNIEYPLCEGGLDARDWQRGLSLESGYTNCVDITVLYAPEIDPGAGFANSGTTPYSLGSFVFVPRQGQTTTSIKSYATFTMDRVDSYYISEPTNIALSVNNEETQQSSSSQSSSSRTTSSRSSNTPSPSPSPSPTPTPPSPAPTPPPTPTQEIPTLKQNQQPPQQPSQEDQRQRIQDQIREAQKALAEVIHNQAPPIDTTPQPQPVENVDVQETDEAQYIEPRETYQQEEPTNSEQEQTQTLPRELESNADPKQQPTPNFFTRILNWLTGLFS